MDTEMTTLAPCVDRIERLLLAQLRNPCNQELRAALENRKADSDPVRCLAADLAFRLAATERGGDIRLIAEVAVLTGLTEERVTDLVAGGSALTVLVR